jgi:hypothetical protein
MSRSDPERPRAYLAATGIDGAVSSPVPITVEAMPIAFAGAAAVRSNLLIVTVERHGHVFEVVPGRSAYFAMPDERQPTARRFKDEVHAFLAEVSPDCLVFRAGQRRGQLAVGPLVHRMETILDLTPGVLVRKVHHNSLEAWKRENRQRLPEPDPELQIWDFLLREDATAAACLSYALRFGGPVSVKEVC